MENFDKILDSAKLNYRPASVYRKQDFFSIIFYWRPTYTANFQRFRQTFELNRIRDISEREKAAEIMAQTVTEALKAGWQPNTDKFKEAPIKAVAAGIDIGILTAIETALKSKLLKVAKERSRQSFRSNTKHFTDWLKKTGIDKMKARELTKAIAYKYQDALLEQDYSPVTVNTKTEYLSTLFKHMRNTGLIDSNPFEGMEKVKEKESDYYELFTDVEIAAIKKCLTVDNPALWQIFLFVFYCYMRPNSVANIRRKDVDFEARLLFVQGDTHKNGKDAYKQLLTPHIEYLRPYIEGLQPDDYIFSTGKLQPGTKPAVRNRISEAWKLHIIDGLKIDKKLYAAKHTGGSKFVAANAGSENLKWLQMQMSHSDLQTTSIYTNKHKIVMLDEASNNIPKI